MGAGFLKEKTVWKIRLSGGHNLFEKTNKDIQSTLKHAEDLLQSEKYPLDKKLDDLIPKEPGVYIFYSKINNKKAYIGRAIGKNGLHQRIVKQHLYPSYSKSVFKKKIAQEKNLNSKEATRYIENHFTLSWIPISVEGKSLNENKSLAKLTETLLIHEFETEYNNRKAIF